MSKEQVREQLRKISNADLWPPHACAYMYKHLLTRVYTHQRACPHTQTHTHTTLRNVLFENLTLGKTLKQS